MLNLGCIQTHYDHTMPVKKGEKICILILYVDDIIVTGNDLEEIN